MAATGSRIACDQAAVLGLWEVIRKYGWFRKQFHRVVDEIRDRKPRAVVLIDYPGFNLRLARKLRSLGYRGKIIYYISPQVWAWNRKRIPKMAKWLDLMLCIFPFEVELYGQSGLPTVFVGHPFVDKFKEVRLVDAARDAQSVGLFPGSRHREMRAHLPILLETAKRLKAARKGLRFVIAAASEPLAKEALLARNKLTGWGDEECRVVIHEAHQLMQQVAVGIVASGTVTMEAAFFGMPMAIIYKVAPLTYFVGKRLIRVPHLGIVNILAGREIVREYIQDQAKPELLASEMEKLLDNTDDGTLRQERELAEVVSRLSPAVAGVDARTTSERAAEQILGALDR